SGTTNVAGRTGGSGAWSAANLIFNGGSGTEARSIVIGAGTSATAGCGGTSDGGTDSADTRTGSNLPDARVSAPSRPAPMVSMCTTRGVMLSAALVSATFTFGRSDAGFSFGSGTIRGAISPWAMRAIGDTGAHSLCGTP